MKTGALVVGGLFLVISIIGVIIDMLMASKSTDTTTPKSDSATPAVPALVPIDTAADAQAICRFTVELNREAFSPFPLPRGWRCKLFLSGTCLFTTSDWAKTNGIDPLYLEKHGNYTHKHGQLYVDKKQYIRPPLHEDRALHQYSISYTAHGGRLAILLQSSWENFQPPSLRTKGVFEVQVLPLTAAEMGQDTEESERLEREESLRRRAISLAARAHLESNFLDEEYRERYAAQHLTSIVNEDREAWLRVYRDVLEDSALRSLLEAEHTHVMPWLEALLETARIAERLALQPKQQKKRLSREAWQARIERYRQRQVDRMRVDADDRIARLLARYEALERLREQAAQFGLDDDKIEDLEDELERELKSDVDEDEEEEGYRQA